MTVDIRNTLNSQLEAEAEAATDDSASEALAVPDVVQRFIRQFSIAAKSVRLYPTSSEIPRDRARGLLTLLREAHETLPELTFRFSLGGLSYNDVPLFPGQERYRELAREFYIRNVDDVRFRTGVSARELAAFLTLLLLSPTELREQGGFEAKLIERDISNIVVYEIAGRIIETGDDLEGAFIDTGPAPSNKEIEDTLMAGGAMAHRMLARLAGDDSLLAGFLGSASGPGDGSDDAEVVERRIGALAAAVVVEPDQDRELLKPALRSGLLTLPFADRHALLLGKMIPAARVNAEKRESLSGLSLNELAAAAVSDVAAATADEARSAVVRALRDVELPAESRDSGRRGSSGGMRLGLGQTYHGNVLAPAMPSHTETYGGEAEEEHADIAEVLEIVELAATPKPIDGDDPEVVALREEAQAPVDDGDVLATMVAVAATERRPEQFEKVAASLEGVMSVLLEGRHFAATTEAAHELTAALHDASRPPDQKTRLKVGLGPLLDPVSIANTAAALKSYPLDSDEQRDCRGLLKVMCTVGLDRVIEVMADEEDRVARKALVDALSEVAPHFVQELSRRITDDRWYVVRNIVLVLGRTHSPRALPALARAVRHSDPRVRREALRWLRSMPDSRAIGLIAAALNDVDADNVKAAARMLGAMQAASCVGALCDVALGRGPGNRDTNCRVAAIEALGSIGDPAALPVLMTFSAHWTLLGAKSRRELTDAAQSAKARIAAGPASAVPR